jgi:hypothetical protein
MLKKLLIKINLEYRLIHPTIMEKMDHFLKLDIIKKIII